MSWRPFVRLVSCEVTVRSIKSRLIVAVVFARLAPHRIEEYRLEILRAIFDE
jgi:hypothetical protein